MKKTYAFNLLCSVWLCAGAFAAQTPQDLYKEAQIQENTARDPEAAVKLYNEFLQQPGTSRAEQAGAYLHLGLCQARLGHTDEAKTAWRKIIQDYADQPDSYAEALNQLQKAQLAERQEVHPSTPVVQKVYTHPETRWVIDLPRVAITSTLDGKGQLADGALGTASGGISYLFRPHLGLNFEIGGISGDDIFYDDPSGVGTTTTIQRGISYFMPAVRAESPFYGPFALYGKSGIGAYQFHFKGIKAGIPEQKAEKWTPGLMAEVGFILGWYRGLALTAGYNVHFLPQATPPEGFFESLGPNSRASAPDVSQNHGLRILGGPVFGLSFRW